jgi:hypothetical protein
MQARNAAILSPFLVAVRFNGPSHIDLLAFAAAEDMIPELYYSGMADGLYAKWTRLEQRGWVPRTCQAPSLSGNVDVSEVWEPLNLATFAPLVELIPRLEHIREPLNSVSLANAYYTFEVPRSEHPRSVVARLHDQVISRNNRFKLLRPPTSPRYHPEAWKKDQEAKLKFFSEPLSAPIGWINAGNSTQYTLAGLAHQFTAWSLKERAQNYKRSVSAAPFSHIIQTVRSLNLPGSTDWEMLRSSDEYKPELLIKILIPTTSSERRCPAEMVFPLSESKVISERLPILKDVAKRLASGDARDASFEAPQTKNSNQLVAAHWGLSGSKIGDSYTRLFMNGSEQSAVSRYH